MTDTSLPWGATAEDWAHLAYILGLQTDLLPVVSNPEAVISPDSKMSSLGKTPSIYNRKRQVAGLKDWTSRKSTDDNLKLWSKEPDYGICIQTRDVRALDIDIPDPGLAGALVAEIGRAHVLPIRVRHGTGKCLFAFRLSGHYQKRAFKTEGGIVEFLANGQQFVAVGTHPSGTRYEWEGGLPDEIPELTPEQFETLWDSLVAKFATEAPTANTGKDRKHVLQESISQDPIVNRLHETGRVLDVEPDGRLHIVCPFADGHTDGDSRGSSTTYFPAHTGGYEKGHFSCLHASCASRTDADFLEALGLVEDPSADFDVLGVSTEAPAVAKFTFHPAADFAAGPPPRWLIQGLLPEAELIVVFGAPASGKSFFVLDACFAVAQGRPWRGQKAVTKGVVAYICAEGAGGFRKRLNAYAVHNNLELSETEMYVLGDGPNFTKTSDVSHLVKALEAISPSLIVVDTLSRVMVGADENSGQDMGKAIAASKALHQATGATVVLIHHSGKDSSKGSRGHSSLLGAADAEIEIIRDDDNRAATLTKMKDGEGEGSEYGFKLVTVKLGVDEDMQDITSCVVEPTEKALAKTSKVKAPNARERQEQLVLRVLDDMMSEDMSGENVVGYMDLVARCSSEMAPPVDSKRDRRSEIIRLAVERLSANGRLRLCDNRVGWAESEEVR